jgi:iron complex transport system substrate-binding protein
MRKLTGYQLVLVAVIVLIVASLVLLSYIDPSSKDPARTSSSPRRIVSLGPVITNIMIELGAENLIVGNTNYCPKLQDAEKEEPMEKVGTLTEMNVEKVINLKPDLALAVGLTKPAGISKLRDADIEVIRFHDPQSFDELCDQYVRIGTRIDREEKARKIVEDARSEVAKIRALVSEMKPKRVFIQIGANPLYTITKKSFINDFIIFCGGINVAGDRPIGRVRIEDVLEADPDVIVIATMGKVNQQQKELWNRYRSMTAVKNHSVHTIDSYGVCSPTPQMFAKTLKQLVKLIRPELKN